MLRSLLLPLSLLLSTTATADERLHNLSSAAPEADRDALAWALAAHDCAVASGVSAPQRLAVIDYGRSSLLPRLWVFDLEAQVLLFEEHVAHGKNSGADLPTDFSNVQGSLQSSLGLFRTAETYQGGNGYSLRLDGLDSGINDQARARAIVMHGAPYVNPQAAQSQGRLGRSFGCPAVRTAVARSMIDTLKDGQLLFAYYPDADWLRTSAQLDCPAARELLARGATGAGRASAAP